MKILNIETNKIIPLIPLAYVATSESINEIFPIIVSTDNVVISGHKKLKKLLADNIETTDVLVVDKDTKEAYIEANSHRALTVFEQYTLLKSGMDIKVSGIIPRDYDVLENIEQLSADRIELLVSKNINSKNIISLLFLVEEKLDFLFKTLKKFTITNNDLRSFIDNVTRVSASDIEEFTAIEDKVELLTAFYKKAKPFIFRNNETIKKVNTSLPNRTTIRENSSFELSDFELNVSFKNYDDLAKKVEKLASYVASDVAKESLIDLGE